MTSMQCRSVTSTSCACWEFGPPGPPPNILNLCCSHPPPPPPPPPLPPNILNLPTHTDNVMLLNSLVHLYQTLVNKKFHKCKLSKSTKTYCLSTCMSCIFLLNTNVCYCHFMSAELAWELCLLPYFIIT